MQDYMKQQQPQLQEPLSTYEVDRLTNISMTGAQYKAVVVDRFGLTQEAAGQWLGVSPRTGQRYATDGPPEPVAKLLRLMVKLGLKPDDVP